VTAIAAPLPDWPRPRGAIMTVGVSGYGALPGSSAAKSAASVCRNLPGAAQAVPDVPGFRARRCSSSGHCVGVCGREMSSRGRTGWEPAAESSSGRHGNVA
jgi:hypothetical protein